MDKKFGKEQGRERCHLRWPEDDGMPAASAGATFHAMGKMG